MQPVAAQTISDTTKDLNSHGDHGYWQSGQPDVMILWPEDGRNVVNRFTGSAHHPYPYRLWVNPGRGGGFPVVLKNEEVFDNFLEHIQLNSGKDWCQLAETWSNWVGDPPHGCGPHSYTQQRTCSIAADAVKPCPDLCNVATETRTLHLDNGPCPPHPPPLKRCSITAWAPSSDTVCSGETFTQTRTLTDCNRDWRTLRGTLSCAKTCPLSAWAPNRNTACLGDKLSQTRTRADCSSDSRTVQGTRSCPKTCSVSAWMPSASTTCAGKTLSQTRTRADCSSDNRTVQGTRSCPKTCSVSAWTPSASTTCAGKTLSQTRTLANCRTESRTVSGKRTCAPSCQYSCRMQTTGAIMGTLWIMYKKCGSGAYSIHTGAYGRKEVCYANLP